LHIENIGRIKAGIVGATGYAGVEILRLLLNHPEVEISALSSVSFPGQNITDIYPNLQGRIDMELVGQEEVITRSQVVFGALPHGLSEDLAFRCMERGVLYIDMGADFRLKDSDEYQRWYGESFKHPQLHQMAVYGIPELFRDAIKTASIIANPGCYPTAAALGLAPAIRSGLIEPEGIIIDAKSGVSGAGRTPTQNTHFPECQDSFSPYKVAMHRHTPEIEQTLTAVGDSRASVTFVPHLLPVSRGILSTMYARRKSHCSVSVVQEIYSQAYENERFVRLLPPGQTADIRRVAYSNYCDISIHEDRRNDLLIVVSAIDNMVKGAAGQAIQNMNIRLRVRENVGIDMVPSAF
jgi:N-acetyl-gamma-glutamyl-phosphate reductase